MTLSNRQYRAGISTFFFIQGLTFASWASRITDVKLKFELNDAELGTLLLCLAIGELIGSPIVAWLVSKFTSRATLHAGFVLYPGSLLLIGLATTPLTLSLALLFSGMACCCMNLSINTQAVSLEQIYGKSIMASFHGMWSLGGFAGGMLGMLTSNLGLSMMQHFTSMAIAGWSIALLVRRRMLTSDMKKAPDDLAQKPSKATTLTARLREKLSIETLIIILGAVVFGCSVCEGVMYDWTIEYFRAVVQPDDRYVRMGYVCTMLAMTLGRFTADNLVRRWNAIAVIRVGGATVAAGLLLAVLLPHTVPASIGFFLVGAGVSSVVPLCFGMASCARKIAPSSAIAIVSAIGLCGFLSGPPMIGFISHAFGTLKAALIFVACFGVMTSAIVGVVRKWIK